MTFPCRLLALAALCLSAGAAEIHVAPDAPEGGDGSAAKPFRTPDAALARLRSRTPAQKTEPVRVVLHAGTYVLSESLRLDAATGGTADAPVTWVGDGEVTLSGGRLVPPEQLRPVTDAATLARLPEGRDAGTRLYEIRPEALGLAALPELESRGMRYTYEAAWPQLFLDGAPLPLASWPDGIGYAGGFKPTRIVSAGTAAKIAAGGVTATGGGKPAGPMAFTFDNPRTARWRTAMRDHHAAVWFGGHWFWDWADDFLPAAAIGDDGVITIGKPHHYGLGKDHANLRVYNLVEEMDRAGEYVLEPANRRVLVLLKESDARAGLTLSALGEPLLRLDGAAHVNFEHLRFAHGRADGATVSGADAIAFRRCEFDGLGRHGLSLTGTRLTVEDSRFTRLGACGVSVAGGDRKTLTAAHNRVSRCEFRDFSRLKRTYAPGVNITGVGTTVEHCLFSEAPHTAILFAGNEHTLRDNEITRVLTETGDCGAIYGGRDWTTFGTVISGNWIHDLGGQPGRWPSGIYLDDAMSGITVRGNLVERVSLGLLVGGGRHVTAEGNIFHHCDEGMHLDARAIGWMKDWSTLRAHLAAIDPKAEPWVSRYPQVKDTLANEPGKPVGTRITGNATVACKKPWKGKTPAGVATVAPNWENAKGVALVESDGTVSATGTPLVFKKPAVGPKSPR